MIRDLTVRRWGLLTLCVLGLLLALRSAFADSYVGGDFGLSATPSSAPLTASLSIVPGSAAAASGIRNGDLLELRQISPGTRFRLWLGPIIDEPLDLVVQRGGAYRHVTLVTHQPYPFTWKGWLLYGGELWIVFFCALLAWRRPQSDEAASLVLYLLGVFVISQGLGDISTRWPAVDAIGFGFKGIVIVFGFAMVGVYATLFGRPLSAFRRALTVATFVLAAVTTLVGLGVLAGVWNGSIDPFSVSLPLIRTVPAFRLALTGVLLTLIISLVATLRVARGPERTRLLWGMTVVFPFFLFTCFTTITGGLVALSAFGTISAIFWFATPAILSYSLLNRQLLDIGFIVNRAAVFTAMSVLILGAFVLVEWLLTDWLRDAGHVTNVLVSGGIALALGFSARFMHTRIDSLVDKVFFRRRHQDEEAIRTFAQEAPYITDRPALLERTSATLERHTDARSVHVLLSYDENDPAIVRLRATRQTLDLRGTGSALEGDVAFPMIARGRLLGIIVLGERRSGEAYAPDERSAVSQLASSVGTTLDVLASHDEPGDGVEPIAAAIDALREEIVRRLPNPQASPEPIG